MDRSINYFCNCKKFADDFVMFFKDTVSVPREQELQWKKFEDFVKSWHMHNACSNSLFPSCSKLLFPEILKKLKMQSKCEKIKLITEIFNIISYIYVKQGEFRPQCHLNYFIYGLNSGLTTFYSNDDFEVLQFVAALKVKSSEYTTLLVKFGLLPRLNIRFSMFSEMGIYWIVYEFMQMMYGNINDRLDTSYCVYSKSKIIFKIAEYLLLRGNYDGSFKRIYLTMIAVQAAAFNFRNQEIMAKEYVYFLRMYFVDTRDPFITINEVRCVLYACLAVLKELQLFESFSKEFVKIMPECSAKLEPRSLTNLARCQIRENLKNRKLHFPAAVINLNLPQPLKEFVVGDIVYMSRKSGNASPDHIITNSQLDEFFYESQVF